MAEIRYASPTHFDSRGGTRFVKTIGLEAVGIGDDIHLAPINSKGTPTESIRICLPRTREAVDALVAALYELVDRVHCGRCRVGMAPVAAVVLSNGAKVCPDCATAPPSAREFAQYWDLNEGYSVGFEGADLNSLADDVGGVLVMPADPKGRGHLMYNIAIYRRPDGTFVTVANLDGFPYAVDGTEDGIRAAVAAKA